MNLFDLNYSKTVIFWNIITIQNYSSILIYFYVIYSCDGKAEFLAAITSVSVTWSFRNHSNMLIWWRWFKKIYIYYYYYYNVDQLCCLIFFFCIIFCFKTLFILKNGYVCLSQQIYCIFSSQIKMSQLSDLVWSKCTVELTQNSCAKWDRFLLLAVVVESQVPCAGVQILYKHGLVQNHRLNTASLTGRLHYAPFLLSIQTLHIVVLQREKRRNKGNERGRFYVFVISSGLTAFIHIKQWDTLKLSYMNDFI